MSHLTDSYRSQWAAVEPRIAEGIRTFRTVQADLRVVDASGRRLPGAQVSLRQVRHAFLFGANCFLLGGYDDAGMNQRYEERFLQLFNAATVAMYWKELEREPGRPRYAADAERVWRRPPTDPVIAWCRQHDLCINGHTLVWDNPKWQVPTWLPKDDRAEAGRLLGKRIRELAARYGHVVQRWDVLNEKLNSFNRAPHNGDQGYPEDFDILAFREAMAALPPEATLMINDYFGSWDPAFRGYHELIARLASLGARIDAVGLQCHTFAAADMQKICRGERHRPADLLAALDNYRDLARPLHVSEITIPQPTEDEAGAEAQAQVARDFYRLWFSHPQVTSITWWNLADGGAAPGEDKVLSGLLDREHQPKEAYTALDRLINQEWTTRAEGLVTDADGQVRLRAFKGDYEVTVRIAGRDTVHRATLATDGVATITLA
jgi:GH35 family endo-1,4-beta-xylanase